MSTRRTDGPYAVITADIVHSRSVLNLQRTRDELLSRLSREHRQRKLILAPYTVTAWDEFQTVASSPRHVPAIIFDLRRHFYPLQLRVAVGLGSAVNVSKRPINVFAGGEAFERARIAADNLKSEKGKYRTFTGFNSADEQFDRLVNFIYSLHDTLMQRVKQKQWHTINVQLATGNQELTAKKMRLNVSTVSRNLQRGFFWQMQDTVSMMTGIVRDQFPG